MKTSFIATILLIILSTGVNAQQYSTKTGVNALFHEYLGGANTATGYYSLYNTTSSWNNSGHGAFTLMSNTTGHHNSAYGVNALSMNIGGYENTAVGYYALDNNVYGIGNTAVGSYSLRQTNSNYNTALGYNALGDLMSGSMNVSLGDRSGLLNSTGSLNTYIGGRNASMSNYSNSTAIGAESYINQSNLVLFGGVETYYIGGSASWTAVSDKRSKRNISSNIPGLNLINQLRPVTYKLDHLRLQQFFGSTNNEDSLSGTIRGSVFEIPYKDQVFTGFIAQEVDSALQNIDFDFSGLHRPTEKGSIYRIEYETFVMPLIMAFKELSEEKKDLDAKIYALKNKIQKLKARVKKL